MFPVMSAVKTLPRDRKTDGVNETSKRCHSEEGIGSDFLLRRWITPVEELFIIPAVGFFPVSISFSSRVSTSTRAPTAIGLGVTGYRSP